MLQAVRKQGSAVSIDGRKIGPHMPPYVVAELSCNHNGSFDRLLNMIDAAKDSGADAAKLQLYSPEELTTPEHEELWELYSKAQTPRSWYRPAQDFAADIGLTLFASAFSADTVKFLQDMDAPAIKIASAEIYDRGLIKAALWTGLPIVVSTGMLEDIEDLEAFPNNRTVVLHCVAKYPAAIEESNLAAIQRIKHGYGCPQLVGLSDHTPGYETAIAATALGAVMIEKHFKIDDDCIDAAYSLNPTDFAAMCKAVRAIHTGMGDGVIRPTCKPRER